MLQCSRQMYYKQLKKYRRVSTQEKIVLELAAVIVEDFPKIGLDKLYYGISDFLKMLSINYGRDKFRKLMERVTFRKPQKRRKKVYYTNLMHENRKYRNRIRGKVITAINQVWHIDITELKYRGMKLYMTVILDAYSRKILANEISYTLTTEVTSLRALETALLYGKPEIIHGDRGTQFRSDAWNSALKKLKIKRSYSRAGKPTENGKIERVFSTLKSELGLRKLTAINTEVYIIKVDGIINKYNSMRTHQSLKYKTPDNIFFNNPCQPIPA